MESPEVAPPFGLPEPRRSSGGSGAFGAASVLLLTLVLLGALFLLLFPVLPHSVLAPFGRARARPLPPPLAAYPDFEALGAVARQQLRNDLRQGGPSLVWISWTASGDTDRWDDRFVTLTGQVGMTRYFWNRAVQGALSGPRYPRPIDLARVQSILDHLGPSVSPPPIDRLLVVSFRRNGRWTTRIYDRARLPPEIADLWREVEPPASRRQLADPWRL